MVKWLVINLSLLSPRQYIIKDPDNLCKEAVDMDLMDF